MSITIIGFCLTFLAQVVKRREKMRDINEINPYIRLTMDGAIPAGWVIPNRIIYDYEIIYIAKESVTITCDGHDYLFKEGDFVFLRPGITHKFHNIKKDVWQPHIHFDFFYNFDSSKIPVSFKDIDEFTDEEKRMIRDDVFSDYPTSPVIRFSDSDMARKLLYDVVNFSGENTLMQKSLMLQLIKMLIEDNFPDTFGVKEDITQSIAQNIKAYIETKDGIRADLSDLETVFMYNRFYLERVFKRAYGESIISYRNKRRMEFAKMLLQNKTVTEVAEEVGYGSIYSFSRAFRTHFGINPSDV